MSQKWYNKATVQSAIVNGAPVLLTAIVGILGIYLTYRFNKNQLDQNYDLFRKQFQRDSISSNTQYALTNEQLFLFREELKLFKKQTSIDSINLDYSTAQNKSMEYQGKMQNITDWIKLKGIYFKVIDQMQIYYQANDTIPLYERVSKNGAYRVFAPYLNSYEIIYKWATDLKNILDSASTTYYLNSHLDLYNKWDEMKKDALGVQIVTKMLINQPKEMEKNYNFDSDYEDLHKELGKLIEQINNEQEKINKIIEE